MNERVLELLEKAGVKLHPCGRPIPASLASNFDEFVDLIVQESFDVVINDGRFHDAKGVLRAGKSVAMEHFGDREW